MDMNQVANKAEEMSHAAGRMQEVARQKLSDVSNRLTERSRVAATSTDAYVHEYAWSSVALAALLGVVIGLMIRRQ